MEADYSKRELDHKFNDVHDKLDQILVQTKKHNGRMNRIEKIMLVVGTVVLVLLIENGSSFVDFAKELFL